MCTSTSPRRGARTTSTTPSTTAAGARRAAAAGEAGGRAGAGGGGVGPPPGGGPRRGGRGGPQPLGVDLDVPLDLAAGGRSDDLADPVDYGGVCSAAGRAVAAAPA